MTISPRRITVSAEGLPSTRKAALADGSKYYYTGKACINGHLSTRTADGNCMECNWIRAKKRVFSPAAAENNRVGNLVRIRRKLADPVERERIREREKAVSQTPTRKAKKAEKDKIRNARLAQDDEHVEKRALRGRIYYHSTLKHSAKYKSDAKDYSKVWRIDNRDKEYARVAERRFYRINGTQPWKHLRWFRHKIAIIYATAREMTIFCGEPYVVDHIVPLKGANFCGLHVPWNLQIITAKKNGEKGNKLPPKNQLRCTIDNSSYT